ncbi:MAG: hypothetical protein J6M02_03630 [Clostridia bacterium]|nr:hypothetical protein [Clostridia bacterium]
MECTVNSFVELRENIIKNDILNKLLLATLSRLKSSDTIFVGITRLPPVTETVKRLKEQCKSFTATSLLYDILVKNELYYSYIGIRYPGHPIIWGSGIFLKNMGDIAKLKLITKKIFQSYPIQSNEKLKQYPPEFKEFLESSQNSIQAWESGSIKLGPESSVKSVNAVVQEYQKQLNDLLSDYRILNRLLIQLLKHYKHYNFISDYETLTIVPSTMNESFLFEYRNVKTSDKQTELLYLYELTPRIYNTKTHKIPLSLIKKFLDNRPFPPISQHKPIR